MTATRMRVAAVLLAPILGALAACGGGGDDATVDASTTTAVPATTGTTLPGTPPTTVAPPSTLGEVAVQLDEIATVSAPTAMAVRAGDPSLYVTEQEGRVRRIAVTVDEEGDPPEYTLERSAVLDISDDVVAGGEQGLLGITFSPDGRRLYVAYTGTDERQYVDEYEMQTTTVDTRSRRNIFTIDDFAPNHNGGQVAFGPDGFLYYGMGDGGGGGDPEDTGQDPSDLLGALLRVDPDAATDDTPYGVPDGNPFADGTGGAPEVFSFGLRNPWRFSFDRETGDLWIADVGQGEWEEVDYIAANGPLRGGAGVNFGWNEVEGTHEFDGGPPDGAVAPIYEYNHDEGGCSVTGGFVYRGEDIPALVGTYLFTDYCVGDILALVHDAGRVTEVRALGINAGNPSSFGEDETGEVFVLDLNGPIYKLTPG